MTAEEDYVVLSMPDESVKRRRTKRREAILLLLSRTKSIS
jgi:hypothetical protein